VSTIIFRTIAPYLAALMMLFSVFVLLRGHNEPGGGFIGGLIAAASLAIYGIAYGPDAVRRAISIHPNALAGIGLTASTAAGFLSLPFAKPILTGLWVVPTIGGVEVALSTVLLFDVGVYLVVLGSFASIALTLEEAD
jgi:multicomponent Na+:H+ antiporter subunit B